MCALCGHKVDVACVGVGAGERAIESLLSTNPDPDHVTHAHAGEGPLPRAAADHSPTPSIDSDKENNVEMVNLLPHPNTPGGAADTPLALKQQRDDTFVDVVEEEDQQAEQQHLKGDAHASSKVGRSFSQWHLSIITYLCIEQISYLLILEFATLGLEVFAYRVTLHIDNNRQIRALLSASLIQRRKQ